MQILKKCLHLGISRAALLLAAAVLLAGCGRSGERVRMLLADTAASFSDDLALSLDAPGDAQTEPANEDPEPEPIAVFVCGAVKEPGVYSLPVGARACDALKKAGGFRDDADKEYVNLARRVEDGEVLRFYALEQTSSQGPSAGTDPGSSGAVTDPSAEVDINLAGYDTLVALPGIGDVKAKAIIQYRSENGPFTQITQIMLVKGISNSLFEKIRDLITV